jgi:hypothetical protein
LKFRPFAEAKEYVHSLGLKSEKEWRIWCKSGKKPDDIPYDASKTYKNEWKGMGDWLGTGRIANQNKEYWLYSKAKEFVHSLGLRNLEQWYKYCASGEKPEYIPSNPNLVYKNEWKGMGDWLGTGTVATRRRTYRSFAKAKEFAHSLGIKSWEEWVKWAKSDNKPNDIPSNPDKVYEQEWVSWPDWLDTDNIAGFKKIYRSFEESKIFVHSLGLKSWEEYLEAEKRSATLRNLLYSEEIAVRMGAL